jgi:NAD(P) transhydrogenase subunit alpha
VGLKITVPKESAPDEKRAAVSPDSVKKLTTLGCMVMIESGAGMASSISDDAFKAAGAVIAKGSTDLYKGANIVLRVQAPNDKELSAIPKGALLIGMLAPYANTELANALAKAGIDSFSMEMVPRISRAQSMDVLSSQSNLAGYKAVLDAASLYNRAFPMMMTAAGTVPPAKVFVMGAGVAGLQAIATARRLGAVVTATDVRPAAKEQVESLGASFVAIEDDEFKEAETAGGYAKEMSKAYQKKQAALVEEHIAKQDIVITTALIPGRPAPKLITNAMVKSMKAGSVIIDLAVETGGNAEPSKEGKVIEKDGVYVAGYRNVPSRLAADASALYAKNLLNLLLLIIDKDDAKLAIDDKDEIIQGVTITRGGKIVHPRFAEEKKASAKPKATPKKKVASTAKAKPKAKSANKAKTTKTTKGDK